MIGWLFKNVPNKLHHFKMQKYGGSFFQVVQLRLEHGGRNKSETVCCTFVKYRIFLLDHSKMKFNCPCWISKCFPGYHTSFNRMTLIVLLLFYRLFYEIYIHFSIKILSTDFNIFLYFSTRFLIFRIKFSFSCPWTFTDVNCEC